MNVRAAIAILLAGSALACVQRPVRSPEEALRSHDLDWTLTAEPEPSGAEDPP